MINYTVIIPKLDVVQPISSQSTKKKRKRTSRNKNVLQLQSKEPRANPAVKLAYRVPFYHSIGI
jgi:hypothetical protein